MPQSPHHRITFSGVLGTIASPLEQWSFSLNTSHYPEAELDAAAWQSLADACWTAYDANLKALMPSDVILTETRIASITAAGKTRKGGSGEYEQGITVSGTNGSGAPQGVPPQCALVVSLMTERAGPTGKGRFFLPMPAFPVSVTTKRLSAPNAQTVSDACAEFIRDLNLVSPFVCVASGGTQANGYTGYNTVVSGVRVGLAVDTLRSRRRDMIESYVTTPL